MKTSTPDIAAGSRLVLLVLAAGQFLMTLDSSVMNVSIATVASDLGTTVTGIQTAITLYTLVMASLMITGGKIGAIIGRRRAFAIGLIIYSIGSFITAIAPTLPVLILGWSILEGIGAALIMPAIVALVAVNFAPARRSSAYGMIAAAGAIAVAAGPLIGGAFTTFASWRWVFIGEVVICMVILALLRKINDTPPGKRIAHRHHRRRLVHTRPVDGRVRRAAIQRMGLATAKTGCAGAVRHVAHAVAHFGRAVCAVGVHTMGKAHGAPRQRAAPAPGYAQQ